MAVLLFRLPLYRFHRLPLLWHLIIPDKIRDPFFPGNTKRSEASGEYSERQSWGLGPALPDWPLLPPAGGHPLHLPILSSPGGAHQCTSSTSDSWSGMCHLAAGQELGPGPWPLGIPAYDGSCRLDLAAFTQA